MANGVARQGFDIDLLEGQREEKALADILLRRYVEVKTDYLAAKTGNVFVEYAQPTGTSGIAATTAHWWAFKLVGLDVVLIVETDRLKALARKALKDGRKARGGDYGKYEGVLVPLEWLVRPFQEMTR